MELREIDLSVFVGSQFGLEGDGFEHRGIIVGIRKNGGVLVVDRGRLLRKDPGREWRDENEEDKKREICINLSQYSSPLDVEFGVQFLHTDTFRAFTLYKKGSNRLIQFE